MNGDNNMVQSSADDGFNVNSFPPQATPEIVSVNKKGSGGDNKAGKAIFILVIGSLLVGGLVFFGQKYLNDKKAAMRANTAPKTAESGPDPFNPEKTGTKAPKPKLGSDSGAPPVAAAAPTPMQPGANRNDGIRPLRGADGKVMVNAQGRAMGVDSQGNVVEVPAISALMDDVSTKKPLPGQQVAGNPQGQGGAPQPKPPSRYGGSLFVGDAAKSNSDSTSGSPQSAMQSYLELLKSAGAAGVPGAANKGTAQGPGALAPTQSSTATPFFGQPPGAVLNPPAQAERPGTVGATLYGSATPVALARRLSDQNLILPKGRQADCILTGRISDEVPGFTSCVLAQNMYSDNGRVLLMERGSELTGEYGVTNQLGNERLFVTWLRLKTPEGIEVDLSSPGTDRLGTSGLLGHLDNRWGARIGASLLLSFVKDISVAVINNQTRSNSGGTSVSIQTQQPGQATIGAGTALAEEVIKQTIKIRPRLTINEGDRIAVYVARDLDFSPVYALKASGAGGAARVLAK
jgi:type IV secretion system protein VirB10